jgi:hypothetical protein
MVGRGEVVDSVAVVVGPVSTTASAVDVDIVSVTIDTEVAA